MKAIWIIPPSQEDIDDLIYAGEDSYVSTR